MKLTHAFNQSILALAILVFLSCAASVSAGQQHVDSIGLFETHTDVGDNPRKGTASYDAANGEYRITGGGANMWGKVDAFHFVWKRATGNFTITADVHFIGKGAEEHRKPCWRCVKVSTPMPPMPMNAHGDSLTALQFRPISGRNFEYGRA
jgi:hypothetical protein